MDYPLALVTRSSLRVRDRKSVFPGSSSLCAGYDFQYLCAGHYRNGCHDWEGINSLARKTLTITLFFIGASLSRDVLKAVGIKPLIQGTLLWIVISVSTLAYIYLF